MITTKERPPVSSQAQLTYAPVYGDNGVRPGHDVPKEELTRNITSQTLFYEQHGMVSIDTLETDRDVEWQFHITSRSVIEFFLR